MSSAYLAYHLSNLRNLEEYLGRRLFKIANRWPRAIGSVEKGIKRPKCVAQKLLKKVNRTRGSSGVNRCDLVYGASSCLFFLSLSLCIIVFSTMIYDRNHCAFVFLSNFFYFLPDNAQDERCVAGHHQLYPGISGVDGRSRVSFYISLKKNSTFY